MEDGNMCRWDFLWNEVLGKKKNARIRLLRYQGGI